MAASPGRGAAVPAGASPLRGAGVPAPVGLGAAPGANTVAGHAANAAPDDAPLTQPAADVAADAPQLGEAATGEASPSAHQRTVLVRVPARRVVRCLKQVGLKAAQQLRAAKLAGAKGHWYLAVVIPETQEVYRWNSSGMQRMIEKFSAQGLMAEVVAYDMMLRAAEDEETTRTATMAGLPLKVQQGVVAVALDYAILPKPAAFPHTRKVGSGTVPSGITAADVHAAGGNSWYPLDVPWVNTKELTAEQAQRLLEAMSNGPVRARLKASVDPMLVQLEQALTGKPRGVDPNILAQAMAVVRRAVGGELLLHRLMHCCGAQASAGRCVHFGGLCSPGVMIVQLCLLIAHLLPAEHATDCQTHWLFLCSCSPCAGGGSAAACCTRWTGGWRWWCCCCRRWC